LEIKIKHNFYKWIFQQGDSIFFMIWPAGTLADRFIYRITTLIANSFAKLAFASSFSLFFNGLFS